MLKADVIPYVLKFKEPGGTSRGIMLFRKVWYIRLWNTNDPSIIGVGECAPLEGLSCDASDYENKLKEICENIDFWIINIHLLEAYPSIRFGLEMSWLDYRHGGNRRWFPSDFTEGRAGIKINGLIWMGACDEMEKRIREKLKKGFTCLKLKIGAIGFEQELSLLRSLRKKFSESDLELRVDANGAFHKEDALRKLDCLSEFKIHSIEQPIRAGQWEEMAYLCKNTPVPIALDEELIGIHSKADRTNLLNAIVPQYIILKPSLTGGFYTSDEWIALAEEYRIGWWVTSALESNIGLAAIAQWTYMKEAHLPQGLGTGQVFTNNIPSRLMLKGENLFQKPILRNRSELNFIIKNSQ